jgi:hypothetical protein
VVLGLVLAVGNVWATVSRSVIPLDLTGTVQAVDVRFQKDPGLDDVWFVTVEGRQLVVDEEVARRLRVGQQVRKEAWSRTLVAADDVIALRLSPDARGMLVVVPAVLVVLGVAAQGGRTGRMAYGVDRRGRR